MRTWDTGALDVEPHRPQIVSSTDAARVVIISLPEGETLQEHEVHERAYVLVLDGELALDGGETVTGGPGLLAEFEPQERHTVTARTDSRLLLFLAPWPGDGHPGAMSLDEKAHARESAQDRGA
jgi:quercetin dioxygenase-like cupin family protein